MFQIDASVKRCQVKCFVLIDSRSFEPGTTTFKVYHILAGIQGNYEKNFFQVLKRQGTE